MRSNELSIPIVTLDGISADMFDPFQNARALMVPVRPAYSSSVLPGSPPPVPSMPPPLPSMPPPPVPTSAPPPVPTMPPPPPPSSGLGIFATTSVSPPPVPLKPTDGGNGISFDNPFASTASAVPLSSVPSVPPPSPGAASTSSSGGFSWLTGTSKSSVKASSSAQVSSTYIAPTSSTVLSSTPGYAPPTSVNMNNNSSGDGIIDEDDFLASFGKSSMSTTSAANSNGPVINETNFMSAATTKGTSKSGINKKAPLVKVGSARGGTSGGIGGLDDLLGTGSTAPLTHSAPAALLSASQFPTSGTVSAPQNGVGAPYLTTEQQIAHTQAQIAQVASQMQQYKPAGPPVQNPGTLLNQGSNLAVPITPNLNFSAIGAKPQQMLGTSPITGNPGMGNPGLGNPSMGNPGMGNPSMGNIGMGNPSMGNPGMGHMGFSNTSMGPGVGNAGMANPSMGNSGMGNSGMGYPGMGSPGMGNPGMGYPGMGSPGVGMGMPGMNAPISTGAGMSMGAGNAAMNNPGVGLNMSMGGYTGQQYPGMQQQQQQHYGGYGNPPSQQAQYGSYGQMPMQQQPQLSYGQPVSSGQHNPGVYRPPQLSMPPAQQPGRGPQQQANNKSNAFDFMN
jgi:hypothetical protein